MSIYMYNKCLELIPKMVDTLVHNEKEIDEYLETVTYYYKDGKEQSVDTFEVGELVMLDHVKRAKRAGFDISYDDFGVYVTRHFDDGRKIIATYKPIYSESEVIL